jgi:translation initiation factor IF-2
MSENKEQEPKKVLSLSGRPKLELKRGPDATSQVRQSFSHGRSKAVTVEVKTQRVARPPLTLPQAEAPVRAPEQPQRRTEAPPPRAGAVPRRRRRRSSRTVVRMTLT